MYKEKGPSTLLKSDYGNRKSELEPHAADIIKLFTNQPPFNVVQAARQIYQLTGIKKSLTQVRSFLAKQGFKYWKIGHKPTGLNVAEQKAFKKTLNPAIKQDSKEELEEYPKLCS